ncbi:wolframin isoform X2 [Bacillus rossius redtenbacheri]|uniref:wolframin isoform X2 n=1 Tax=Bacillus rossius redtenbacheri TaxID=93214 RepID=UPI002FDE47C5
MKRISPKTMNCLDGPRGSLRRLRSQLAEDGCPESQVVLAKQLLEEQCELDGDRQENARLGVYWLIKASEQGNVEATSILKQCLETGQGISEHNYLDVKMCLNMSQDEKLARRAAREMFSSLSAGQDYITTDQLERQIRLSERSKLEVGRRSRAQLKSSEPLGDAVEDELASADADDICEEEAPEVWTLRGEYSGEKLTEDHLVSAAVSYAHGELPLVHRVLALSGTSRQEAHFLQRLLLHPVASFQAAFWDLVAGVARRGTPFLSSLGPITRSHLHTLLLLLVYSLLGADSIILLLPMVLYHASFCVMVVATLQILHRRHEFQDFRVWSRLFLGYSGGGLNPDEAEFQYCRSSLKPYGHFFLALLANLVLYPLVAPRWTPQSEFTVVAFLLTFLTLYAFMDRRWPPDFLALFSFAVHVLAKYPYESDAVVRQGWRFLDVRAPTLASYVVGNGVEFCLNFRAVFYLVIPAVLVRMAARDGWRGIYKTLVPHCVTLSWWQLAVILSQGATWYGLVRGALALVGLVFFLPLAGLATLLLPGAAVLKYLLDSKMVVLAVVATVVAAVPVLLTWYADVQRRRRRRGAHFLDRLTTLIQVAFAVLAALFLAQSLARDLGAEAGPDYQQPGATALGWEQYQNHCHQPAWEQASMGAAQVRCAHLAGVQVAWEGYVADVRVGSVRNTLEAVLSRLPGAVRDALVCWFGEEYRRDCLVGDSCRVAERLKLQHARCHLEAWNRYEFEIAVKMKSGMWGSGAVVTLVADDSFRNFTLALRTGDRVWFSGALFSGAAPEALLGGPKPRVQLDEIGCLGCHGGELPIHKRKPASTGTTTLAGYLYAGLKSVLNFMFNPLVIFR